MSISRVQALPLRKWLWKPAKRSANATCSCGCSTIRFDNLLARCSKCNAAIRSVSPVIRGRMLQAAHSIGSTEASPNAQLLDEAAERSRHLRDIKCG